MYLQGLGNRYQLYNRDQMFWWDCADAKDDLNLHNQKQVREKKVQEVPQSQTAALPRHQEEEETDKFKQAQIEQTYEKN